MIGRNNCVYCDYCRARIEKLTEQEALDSMSVEGWTNYETADRHACLDCANNQGSLLPYETYVAMRIKRGKLLAHFPDIQDPDNDQEVECHTSPFRKYNRKEDR